ncbi:hypothetical protein RZP17_31840, partial [Klebsiella variicola subsp. variicola]|nr:hypothetical protein [Klebsiella variicola subsp. variicola]
SFCDAGKHTVGMCVSRLARELSPKDGKGKVIPETEVTIRRVSALIAEQVRFGVLGVSEETAWDRGLTLSGTKTHVKQRFLPLTPLLMVS